MANKRIINKHSAPLGLPPVTGDRIKQLKDNHGVTVKGDHGADKFLMPGENNVDADHWAAVKDHTVVKTWLDEGLLSEGDDKDTSKPEGASTPDTLEGVPPARAARMIAESSDRETLANWQKSEKRPEVKDAIQRRSEALGSGK